MFTIIDPRKPLPEAVNARFDSGEIQRILVSSPWMPPICSHCKEVGHSVKRCKTAPITCKGCKSTSHSPATCPRAKGNGTRKPLREKGRDLSPVITVNAVEAPGVQSPTQSPAKQVYFESEKQVYVVKPNPPKQSVGSLAVGSGLLIGESSLAKGKGKISSDTEQELVSEAEADSSDIQSSEESDKDYGYEEENEFKEVVSKRNRRNSRGMGPKLR